ncbi:MAG: hypothetical protein B7C24_17960 [Bacteroidetes bacterium 4572_77]|nr:MAG: hypothetical protein B7C24_17960 [Bacteroidetes bacterium 4572_77]
MKILINLLSEQTIPNLVAIKHFKPSSVMALTTQEYKNQVKHFERVTQVSHQEVDVEAYDMPKNLSVLGDVLKNTQQDELIINYTGGTKIMAMAAMLKVLLSAEQNVQLAYINTKNLSVEIINVGADKSLKAENQKIRVSIPIEEYFRIKGEEIDTYDFEMTKHENERLVLSKQLMKSPQLSSIFKKQHTFFKNNRPLPTHRISTGDKFDLFWDAKEIILRQGNRLFDYKHGDGGHYFTGAWLEELVFNKLHKSKKFDQVLKNLKINFKTGLSQFNKNEMDVVVTKGFKTAFVECKAGNIKQEHVYKLHAITNYFLGSFGVPILIARYKPQANIMEKCKDLGVYVFTAWQYDYLDIEIEKLLK